MCKVCGLSLQVINGRRAHLINGKQVNCALAQRNYYLTHLDEIIVYKPGMNQPRKAGRI